MTSFNLKNRAGIEVPLVDFMDQALLTFNKTANSYQEKENQKASSLESLEKKFDAFKKDSEARFERQEKMLERQAKMLERQGITIERQEKTIERQENTIEELRNEIKALKEEIRKQAARITELEKFESGYLNIKIVLILRELFMQARDKAIQDWRDSKRISEAEASKSFSILPLLLLVI